MSRDGAVDVAALAADVARVREAVKILLVALPFEVLSREDTSSVLSRLDPAPDPAPDAVMPPRRMVEPTTGKEHDWVPGCAPNGCLPVDPTPPPPALPGPVAGAIAAMRRNGMEPWADALAAWARAAAGPTP